MTENEPDELIRDLTLLGQASEVPEPSPGLTLRVMQTISADPSPGWFASRGRQIAVVIAAVVLALVATPPVRATVADWFGFGGVLVETGSPEPGAAEPPPEVTQSRTLDEVTDEVGFTIFVPKELGDPTGVEVSTDGRLVSMSWSSAPEGVVRLDEFDATLNYSVLKQTPDVVFTSVNGKDAVWFEGPHDVALLERDGTTRTESARLAGQTLIWIAGTTTLRLEGDLSLERAQQIAESSKTID